MDLAFSKPVVICIRALFDELTVTVIHLVCAGSRGAYEWQLPIKGSLAF